MIQLNEEEEAALRELIEAEKSGEKPNDLIRRRLDVENSYTPSFYGRPIGKTYRSPDYEKALSIYESLQRKGCLSEVDVRDASLTSDGRSYFSEKKKSEERERSLIKDRRRHDYRLAAFTAVIGWLLGLVSCRFISTAIQTALEAVSRLLSQTG